MQGQERLRKALDEVAEIKPDVELGKFIRYISSFTNLAYMTDDDLADQIEAYNRQAKKKRYRKFYNYRFLPTMSCGESTDVIKSKKNEGYDFTKENEQIAYDRYKERTKNTRFFTFEERLKGNVFLKRFFKNSNSFREITVINHRDSFSSFFPWVFSYFFSDYNEKKFDDAQKTSPWIIVQAYFIGKRGEDYIATENNFFSIMSYRAGDLKCVDPGPMRRACGYEECFMVVLNDGEYPRFTDYTEHIMFGAVCRPEQKEIEIFTENQTIEMFHALLQKSKVLQNR